MYISEPDKIVIRQLIEQQLQAFKQDDAIAVFNLLSPSIQQKFQPQDFVTTIKNRCSAIAKYRSIMFGRFTLVENYPALVTTLMDCPGDLVKIAFVVQHQPDYSWRIHGYELFSVDGQKTNAVFLD